MKSRIIPTMVCIFSDMEKSISRSPSGTGSGVLGAVYPTCGEEANGGKDGACPCCRAAQGQAPLAEVPDGTEEVAPAKEKGRPSFARHPRLPRSGIVNS